LEATQEGRSAVTVHGRVSKMKWMQTITGCAVLLAAAAQGWAAGEKIIVPIDDVGIVKIKPVCLGEDSALEVEVELKGALPMATCVATVAALDVSEDLEPFDTDDEGEGETKGDVLIVDPPVGEDVTVTVTIVCTDGVTETTHTVQGIVVFEKSCADDDDDEDDDDDDDDEPGTVLGVIRAFLSRLFDLFNRR
jgi:hypothetical protein